MARRQRRRFTDEQVQALPPRASRYAHPDPEQAGLYIRVTPAGVRSFVAVARTPLGRQVWVTLGSTELKIEEARERAREVIRRIKAGLPAVDAPPPAPDSFEVVAGNWIKRHVTAKGLRSQAEIERCLNRYVYPHWGGRPFADIKRRDVAALLDAIEDNHGARQADAV